MSNLPSWPRGLTLLMTLTLAVVACGSFGAEPTATPFAKPTKAPLATPTAAPLATPTAAGVVKPTRTPKPSTTPEPQTVLVVAKEAYAHPSGAFSLRLPDAWEAEEFNASVSATDPTGVGFIEVAFVNVGVEFTAEQLLTYAQAVEENWFATFDNYEPDAPETFESGTVLIFKTIAYDGIPQTIYSYYWQEGTIIYAEDFWVASDQYEAYVDGYSEVSSSTQTDPNAGAQAELYGLRYEFVAPDDLFAFNVPYGWTHTTRTEEAARRDSFNSPDAVTSIESLIFDDGTEISQSLAGEFALTLLKEFYDFSDVRVSADEPLEDGREKLTWSSNASGLDGISYFEARGTTFIMLTWMVEQDATTRYLPFWEGTAASYYVP